MKAMMTSIFKWLSEIAISCELEKSNNKIVG